MEDFDALIQQQKVKLGDKEFTIGEMLLIEQESINEAFTTQASRLAYLGMLLAKAEVTYEAAKADAATLYADLDLEVRTEMEVRKVNDPKFKSTESMIAAEIKQFEEYRQAVGTELQALHDYKVMRGVVNAMRQRGEMLISLGAQLRQEYDVTGLSLLKAELSERKRQRADA